MTLNFEGLNKINSTQSNLLFGYFRQCQSTLNKNHQNKGFNIIPNLVIHITSLYYICEYFETYTKLIIVSENGTVIRRGKDDSIWKNICYGRTKINPFQHKCLYQWIIKYESFSGGMMIGFSSDCTNLNDVHLLYTKSAYYALNCYYGRLSSKNQMVHKHEYTGFKVMKTGDVICLQFNCDGDNSYIKYYVNNKDKGIAFPANEIEMDDDISYRLAVSLCHPKDSVTIIDFDIFSPKCN